MAFGNDVNTMTPGSGVADALEDILTRKRNEARQTMLDSVTRQSAQARANYENAAAASLTQQRAANAQRYQAEADQKRMAAMGANPADVDKSTYDWGSKVSPGSFRMAPGGATLPSTATTGIGSTLPTSSPSIGPAPQATAQPDALPVQSTQVPSAPDASVPATYRYMGSPQYQKRQQTISTLQDLTKDPTFANNPNLQAEIKLAEAFPDVNPEGAVARIMTAKPSQAPGHEYGIDPVTKKRIDFGTFGPNDKSVVIPREPREAGMAPQMFSQKVPNDPNDPTKGVHDETRWIKPGQSWEQGTPLGGSIIKGGPRPDKPVKPIPLYDDKKQKDFTATLGKGGNSTPARTARETAENAFINTISDKDVQADIKTIRSSKNLRMMPADKAMKVVEPPDAIKNDPIKSKEYLDKVRSVLSLLPNYPRLEDK